MAGLPLVQAGHEQKLQRLQDGVGGVRGQQACFHPRLGQQGSTAGQGLTAAGKAHFQRIRGENKGKHASLISGCRGIPGGAKMQE